MGDWNAVVGEEESGSVIGKYGLCRKSERGEKRIRLKKKKGGKQNRKMVSKIEERRQAKKVNTENENVWNYSMDKEE